MYSHQTPLKIRTYEERHRVVVQMLLSAHAILWMGYGKRVYTLYALSRCLPLQLAFIGHAVVAFCMRYAFSVVSDGDLRNVSSSFFHTYVMADCS